MRLLCKIFFLLLPTLVWGQDTLQNKMKHKDEWKSTQSLNNKYGGNFSYAYQTHSTLEIGCSKYLFVTVENTSVDFPQTHHAVRNNWSVGASVEFIIGKHFIIGPKLFSNLSYKWFSAQVNVTAYNDFKKICPVITPEMGIGNWIGIRYGYNLNLTKNVFYEIGSHRIIVFLRLYIPNFTEARSNGY
jgi:hypothetical protein